MQTVIVIFIMTMLLLTGIGFAGENEDLKVQVWQEHLRALQFEIQLSQQELQKALDAKQKADAQKTDDKTGKKE